MFLTASNKLCLILITMMLASCSANEGILKSGKETPGTAPGGNATPRQTVESDLQEMRTAGFSVIFVLRRRDGGVIDSEDKSVVKLHTAEVNRRVLSDEGKAILIGSNFPIPEAGVTALSARFTVENHSPPPLANANVSVNNSVY